MWKRRVYVENSNLRCVCALQREGVYDIKVNTMEKYEFSCRLRRCFGVDEHLSIPRGPWLLIMLWTFWARFVGTRFSSRSSFKSYRRICLVNTRFALERRFTVRCLRMTWWVMAASKRQCNKQDNSRSVAGWVTQLLLPRPHSELLN